MLFAEQSCKTGQPGAGVGVSSARLPSSRADGYSDWPSLLTLQPAGLTNPQTANSRATHTTHHGLTQLTIPTPASGAPGPCAPCSAYKLTAASHRHQLCPDLHRPRGQPHNTSNSVTASDGRSPLQMRKLRPADTEASRKPVARWELEPRSSYDRAAACEP